MRVGEIQELAARGASAYIGNIRQSIRRVSVTPDPHGYNISAVMKRDVRTVKRAVEKKVVDSATCDAYGNTLLILAAQSGSAEIKCRF